MEADDLIGAIAVRTEVDGSGKVSEAVLEASNFGDEQTPGCIVAGFIEVADAMIAQGVV
ncbi:MAG: hypothetical protein H6712_09155 [Myxococcales bacterium]|nr:hypothetical protein [Myxococcales bacterium]MCB9714009.1 hypothetical protein [Myxococcales bacterium]